MSMDFSLVHPPIHPLDVRTIRVFGDTFTLAYLYPWRAFIPAKDVAAAIGVDSEKLLQQYSRNRYLSLYWSNILLPDTGGELQESPCLDVTVLPLLAIAYNLTREYEQEKNHLLDAICDEAVLALAAHFHLGSPEEIRKNRISLAQDVAELRSTSHMPGRPS
jgi:hypothetical protein